jgi:Cdc6-like AAA superfamily ATPase
VRLSQCLAIFHRHHLKFATVGRLAHEVVQWLCAPDTSVDYADALRRRVNNTGSWLIRGEQYGQWKCNSDSLLWIYGTVGFGKTILSSTIVEDLLRHCESGPGIAVAYFYFKLDDVSKKNTTGMLRSLMKQLFERGGGRSHALTKLFGKGNQQPTSSQLLSTLHDMVLEFGHTYIVLDALDECEKRHDLFEVLEEMGRWKSNIHLVCTSRDEKDIKDSIHPIEMAQNHIKLSAAVLKDDIRTCIRERLQTDRGLKRWRGHPKVRTEIENSLTEKSDGM